MVKHLGYLHNTFGRAIQNIIQYIGYQFINRQNSTIQQKKQPQQKNINQKFGKKQQQSVKLPNSNSNNSKKPIKTQYAQKKYPQKNMKYQFKNYASKQLNLDSCSDSDFRGHKNKSNNPNFDEFFKFSSIKKSRANEQQQNKIYPIYNKQKRLLKNSVHALEIQTENKSNQQFTNLDIYSDLQTKSQNSSKANFSQQFNRKSTSNQFEIKKPLNESSKQYHSQRFNYMQNAQKRQHPQQKQSQNQSEHIYRCDPVRKKKDRQQLMGLSCIQCQRFYDCLKVENPTLCQCTSRHRSNYPANKYFNNNFSQELALDQDH